MTPPPAPISVRSLHTAHHPFHQPNVITLPKLGCLIKNNIQGKKGNTFLEPVRHCRAWCHRGVGCQGSASPWAGVTLTSIGYASSITSFYRKETKQVVVHASVQLFQYLCSFLYSCMTKMPYFYICSHTPAAFPAATKPPPHPAVS